MQDMYLPLLQQQQDHLQGQDQHKVSEWYKTSFKWEGQSTTENSFLQRHHVIVLTMSETGTNVVLRGMMAAISGMYNYNCTLSSYIYSLVEYCKNVSS